MNVRGLVLSLLSPFSVREGYGKAHQALLPGVRPAIGTRDSGACYGVEASTEWR